MDVINQVAVTVLPNSEKIIMVRTEVDARGNQCSIFEPQVVSTRSVVPTIARFPAADNLVVDVQVSHIYNTSIFNRFLLYSVVPIVGSLFLVLPLHRLCCRDLLAHILYDLSNHCLLYTSRCV